MSNRIVRVFAQGKRLDTIEKDIRRDLINADKVQIDWNYISDAIPDKPNGDKIAVTTWANLVFPGQWEFHNDDIVINKE